jgi:hypothetical protein
MADPTGTMGRAHESAPDLALATLGGPKFMERLSQLGEAADRNERTLARLQLGQEVETAYRLAAEQVEVAKRDRANAATELADAERKAADILAAADADRASAQEHLRDAEEHLRVAQDKEQRAIAAGDAVRQAVAKAEAAQREAKAAEKKFTDKINRLKAELAQVM